MFIYFFIEGCRKELRLGALLVLNLPQKSISSNSGTNCLPPKERVFIPKTFAKSLLDVKQQLKCYLKPSWQAVVNDNNIHLTKFKDQIHQPMFDVIVSKNLSTIVWYFGWLVFADTTNKLNLYTSSVTQILSKLEQLAVCPGLVFSEKEDDSGLGQKHIVTKPAKLSDSSRFPQKTVLGYRY